MKFRLTIILIFILSLFAACEQSKENLQNLNGYWHVERVVQKGETFRFPNSAPLYDFYELNENIGFRKKVKPLLDGTFETSNDRTDFTVVKKNNKVQLHFKTTWNDWIEEIVILEQKKLALLHEGKTYYYVKSEPLKLDNETTE